MLMVYEVFSENALIRRSDLTPIAELSEMSYITTSTLSFNLGFFVSINENVST